MSQTTRQEAAPSAPDGGGSSAGAGQVAAVVVTVALGGWIIVAAKAFLVPLVLALFAFILVQGLDRIWGRLRIGEHRLPRGVTTVVSALFITAVGLGVVRLVNQNATGVAEASSGYQERLEELLNDLEAKITGIWESDETVGEPNTSGESADRPVALAEGQGRTSPEADDSPARESLDLTDFVVEHLNPAGLATSLAGGLASIIGSVSLVLVYLVFLLLERPFFDAKMRAMFRDDSRRAEVHSMLGRIDHDVSLYLGLKTLVSLMTAIPSYAVMRAVGLNFAEFWAILIFALNFIPNIGSLIATILPSLIALAQFPTLGPFWTIALGLTTIQLVVANLIEPNLLGKRLNMSPLVVIVALVGWSLLWGAPGAFLCVPMTNIGILVLANIRSTRWLAVMLSRDGSLPEQPAT